MNTKEGNIKSGYEEMREKKKVCGFHLCVDMQTEVEKRTDFQ